MDDKLLKKNYYENPGCPNCGSSNIGGSGYVSVNAGLKHTNQCGECSVRWIEIFKLVVVDVQFE